MTRRTETRLSREIRHLLEDTGLEWALEIGGSHMKIILCGKRIGIYSHGTNSRDTKKIAATIKREARAFSGSPHEKGS